MTTEPALDPAPTRRGRIGTAVLVQLLGRAVGTVASIVTVALTTRQLGVHEYGVLTTAIVFVGLWTSLTELGIGAVIVRRVTSGGAERLGPLVGVNIGLSLVYCVPLAIVAAVSGLAVYHDQTAVHRVLLVVCGNLLLSAIANCFNPVFMAHVRFGAVASADALSRVTTLAATVAVVASDGGIVWFGAVQLVPPLVQIIVLGLAARRLEPVRPRFDWATTKGLIRESLPQTGVLIIGVLYWRADAVILTLLGSVREVGVYGLAYTVAFTLSVLSQFYLASSLSTMTTHFAQDVPRFARFITSGIELMLFLGLPVAVFGAVLAHPLISLLSSDRFAGPAAAPLAVLLASVALTFVTAVLSQALFAAKDLRFLLRLNVANLAVNIVLNLALVPAFGAVGSASALAASEVSGAIITTWRLGRSCGYRTPWAFLLRLLPALAAGAAVALALRDLPVLVTAAVVAAAYLGVNLVLGPVRLSTVRALRAGEAA